MSSLSAPIPSLWVVVTWCLCAILAVVVVVWVLLWAVDAQRGQCSLAVRKAERLAVQKHWQKSSLNILSANIRLTRQFVRVADFRLFLQEHKVTFARV